MKVLVRFTDLCLVIRVVSNTHYSPSFYMTREEFETVLKDGHGTFNDCGEVLLVRAEQLVFIENTAHKSELEGTARYVRVPMDTAKFFARVKDLSDRGIIADEFFELDSKSFRFKVEPVRQMTFVEIVRSKRFLALEKLYEAAKTVSKEHIFQLRELISRTIGQGKVVAPDFARVSFYFYPEDGKGYNGGIIYHGPEYGYSIHT